MPPVFPTSNMETTMEMEIDLAEWGFVPTAQDISAALANPWDAKAEWGMGDPDFDFETADDGDQPMWPRG